MTLPTREQIAEWARLAAEATPEPWTAENDREVFSGLMKYGVAYDASRPDNRFIAAARSAVPALIQALIEERARCLFYVLDPTDPAWGDGEFKEWNALDEVDRDEHPNLIRFTNERLDATFGTLRRDKQGYRGAARRSLGLDPEAPR